MLFLQRRKETERQRFGTKRRRMLQYSGSASDYDGITRNTAFVVVGRERKDGADAVAGKAERRFDQAIVVRKFAGR